MHLPPAQRTAPVSSSLYRASKGHPATQPGSKQCMHWRFTKDEGEPSSGLYSLMMLRVKTFRSVGAWCSSSPLVSGGVSLAALQADSQALQPMHRLASYSSPRGALGTVSSSA